MTNGGSKVTEFYLLAADGLRIVGEVENIGPGLSRDLVLAAPAGSYFTACKPGMVGDGIRAPFAVSDSGEDLAPDRRRQGARRPGQRQLRRLRQGPDRAAGGQDRRSSPPPTWPATTTKARALYPRARVHWERIETVAESFGDLDPKMDLREADLEPGQKWTGWHRIEKDLWPARAQGLRAADHRGAARPTPTTW